MNELNSELTGLRISTPPGEQGSSTTNKAPYNYDPSLFDKQKQQLNYQLQVFKDQIIQFSKIHNQELKENLDLARQFVQLCSQIGINFSQLVDNKSTYLFHPMDYYYNLCIELIEVVRNLETMNGGLTSYKELLFRLNESNGSSITDIKQQKTNNNKRSAQDIDKALEMLESLNGGFTKMVIAGKSFIQSVPLELTKDQSLVYEVCFVLGYVTVPILRDNYQWDKIRCKQVLNKMVSDGLLWIDKTEDEANEATLNTSNKFRGEVKYWDPGWIVNL
ncbi:hypothetical protein ACO0RG_003683 [Hanseniaspora osmophila]|uniref:Vacuolar-sorting protein SNF8 n=1 Tax=Hanseniaspora osmophila TaxID=56408 RepID=A0A1E5RFI4_9ASCO